MTVITGGTGSAASGITTTAVCSVLAESSCILVVINQSSRSLALIERTGAFVVNLLSEGQALLAQHFASKPRAASMALLTSQA